MRINADFSKPALIKPDSWVWRPSPMPGVERLMLDRIGGEVARATSIVRYAPNSRFSEHVHNGGEEFLVLSGSFHDTHGDYPVGTYVRNPIGTRHAPWSGPDGTEIFVKLHQFDNDDTRQFCMRAFSKKCRSVAVETRLSRPLHKFGNEAVSIEFLPANYKLRMLSQAGGHEILILAGSFHIKGETYPERSWLRLPDDISVELSAGDNGVEFYHKSGHLERGSTVALTVPQMNTFNERTARFLKRENPVHVLLEQIPPRLARLVEELKRVETTSKKPPT